MKKFFAFLLLVSMVSSLFGCSIVRKSDYYKRVVFIGVSGAGAFFKDTDTPNMDEIFKDGAKSYNVLTTTPAGNAQCWGSLLTGTTPESHKLTDFIIESRPYEHTTTCPTVFKLLNDANPDIIMASVARWTAINRGIVDSELTNITRNAGESDGVAVDNAIRCIRRGNAEFLSVQLNDTNGIGQSDGYGSEEHLRNITYIDSLIGKIYKAITNMGYLDETLFIVTSDHGGTSDGSFGGNTDEEKYVFFGAAGHSVNKDASLDGMTITDTPAIILDAFNVAMPSTKTWVAKAPEDLFFK